MLCRCDKHGGNNDIGQGLGRVSVKMIPLVFIANFIEGLASFSQVGK